MRGHERTLATKGERGRERFGKAYILENIKSNHMSIFTRWSNQYHFFTHIVPLLKGAATRTLSRLKCTPLFAYMYTPFGKPEIPIAHHSVTHQI